VIIIQSKSRAATCTSSKQNPELLDINNADFITAFRPAFDKIGLADGLTVNDIVLENLTNVTLTVQFEVPEAAETPVTPINLNPAIDSDFRDSDQSQEFWRFNRFC
jgi:hypothetical protein